MSLKYRPGREGAVIAGIMAAMEGKAVRTGGSDVSEADIVMAAKRISTAQNISVFVGTDLLRRADGKDALLEIINIAKAIKLSKKNINIMPLLDRCNHGGAGDMAETPHSR